MAHLNSSPVYLSIDLSNVCTFQGYTYMKYFQVEEYCEFTCSFIQFNALVDYTATSL